jgi:hypothetical protein
VQACFARCSVLWYALLACTIGRWYLFTACGISWTLGIYCGARDIAILDCVSKKLYAPRLSDGSGRHFGKTVAHR